MTAQQAEKAIAPFREEFPTLEFTFSLPTGATAAQSLHVRGIAAAGYIVTVQIPMAPEPLSHLHDACTRLVSLQKESPAKKIDR